MLALVIKIATFDEMIALVRRYFPKEPPDARRIAIVGQFAERLNAPPFDDAG